MPEQSCWCCRDYGLTTAASKKDVRAALEGLCDACKNRSPSACKTAHEKDGGKTPPQRLLGSLFGDAS